MARKLYTLRPDRRLQDVCNRIHDIEKVFKSGNAKNPYIEMVTNTSDAGSYREIHHVEGCTAVISDYQPTTDKDEKMCVIKVVGRSSRINKARDRLAEIIETELVEQTES